MLLPALILLLALAAADDSYIYIGTGDCQSNGGKAQAYRKALDSGEAGNEECLAVVSATAEAQAYMLKKNGNCLIYTEGVEVQSLVDDEWTNTFGSNDGEVNGAKAAYAGEAFDLDNSVCIYKCRDGEVDCPAGLDLTTDPWVPGGDDPTAEPIESPTSPVVVTEMPTPVEVIDTEMPTAGEVTEMPTEENPENPTTEMPTTGDVGTKAPTPKKTKEPTKKKKDQTVVNWVLGSFFVIFAIIAMVGVGTCFYDFLGYNEEKPETEGTSEYKEHKEEITF